MTIGKSPIDKTINLIFFKIGSAIRFTSTIDRTFYFFKFLTRLQRDGWYGHRLEDRRARNEADAIIRYFLLYCEWRTDSQRWLLFFITDNN